jgi:hypothetical protein
MTPILADPGTFTSDYLKLLIFTGRVGRNSYSIFMAFLFETYFL